LFDLTDSPFWLSLTDSASLVIDAPNEINIPGKYNFFVGIWEVALEVYAPCGSNYLQGLEETGHVSVYIDSLVVLVVAFELDDKQHSWEKVCGSIQRAFIRDAPTFVTYNEHSKKIEIKPKDKTDKGLHIMLVEWHVKSKRSFSVL